jgi:hypothetical protein
MTIKPGPWAPISFIQELVILYSMIISGISGDICVGTNNICWKHQSVANTMPQIGTSLQNTTNHTLLRGGQKQTTETHTTHEIRN